jgi:sugar-specific transcriptional regulator TrmB
MAINTIIKGMEQIGFSEGAATVYVHILQHGPLSLDDLQVAVQMPLKTLVPFVGELVSRRLIVEDFGSYYALNPRKAFKAIGDDIFWATTVAVNDDLNRVPEEQREEVRRVRMICQELQTLASTLYTYESPIAVGRIKVAQNSDQMAAFLSEAIDRATDQILAVSTSPRQPQLSIIWGSLQPRLEAGVRYRRIVDLEEIVDHGFKIVQRDVKEVGIDLFLIEREKIDRKFYVIDDQFVIMFSPDRLQAYNFTLTGQVISNKLIVGKYKHAFIALLAQAIPASFVLRLMTDDRTRLLRQAAQVLQPVEVEWVECIIDFGTYCRFSKLSPARLAETVQRALDAQLVTKVISAGGFKKILPAYTWSMADIRTAWERTRGGPANDEHSS